MAFVRYFDEETRTVGEQFVNEGASDATGDAVDILDDLRMEIQTECRGLGEPVYAYDGPYLSARLRLCWIEKKAPYAKGNAPNGAYVAWADIPKDAGSWVSRGGWVPCTYRPLEILTHAIVRIAGSDGPWPE